MCTRGGLPCETGTAVFAGCEETRRRGRRRVFAFSGGCLRIAPHVRPSLLKSNVVGTLQSKCCHQSGYLQCGVSPSEKGIDLMYNQASR